MIRAEELGGGGELCNARAGHVQQVATNYCKRVATLPHTRETSDRIRAGDRKGLKMIQVLGELFGIAHLHVVPASLSSLLYQPLDDVSVPKRDEMGAAGAPV